jgi:4-amino-4-deoxy-L-arabinose transferase-like glycosyltransferase
MRSETKKIALHVAVLLLLSLYLYVWRIGDLSFLGTEAHRALPARTMLETHEWLVPKLNGEPFLTKPPLTYWLIGLFSLPGGNVTETSARLPSAVWAVFLVLVIYWFAATVAGTGAGFLSALVALTTFILFEKAVAAEIDMHLTAAVGASLLLAFKGFRSERRRWPYLLAAYVFLSAAFLSKGPPALVFFGATVLGYLAWEKRLSVLRSPANIAGLCLFVFLCGLWIFGVIHAVGMDAILANVRAEFLNRVGRSTSFRPTDLLFYPLGIVGGFAPWSLFLPFALLPSYYRSLSQERRSLHRFLVCGIFINLVLFSLIEGKANRYLLPVYPLLAVLVGLWWRDLIDGRLSERLKNSLPALLILLFGLSAAGFLIFALVKLFFNVPDFPASLPLFLAIVATLLAGLFFSRKAGFRQAFAVIILFFLLIKLVYAFDYVPYRDEGHSMKPVAQALNSRTVPGRTIYTSRFDKPHLFFYLHNPVIRVSDVSFALTDAGAYFLLTEEELKKLVEQGRHPIRLYEFPYRKLRVSLVSFAGEPEESAGTGAAKSYSRDVDDESEIDE